MADVTIEGLDVLVQRMAGITDRAMKNSISVGLRKASNVIRDQAKANFGQAGGPNSISGALRGSIRTSMIF